MLYLKIINSLADMTSRDTVDEICYTRLYCTLKLVVIVGSDAAEPAHELSSALSSLEFNTLDNLAKNAFSRYKTSDE
jgi:hypothetical protein